MWLPVDGSAAPMKIAAPMAAVTGRFPAPRLAAVERARHRVGAGCHGLPSDPVTGTFPPGHDLRLVRTPHEHAMVSMLVQRMYAWRGYRSDAGAWRADDARRLTIAAWHDAAVVATVSLGRDSPAGLLADELYARELGRLRRFERVVCEASRLAVDPDFSSPDLLLALFQTAHACAREHFAASDAVIEVNPRHARYYQRLLGFRQVGEQRQCRRVQAPAVLLHRALDHLSVAAPGRRNEGHIWQ